MLVKMVVWLITRGLSLIPLSKMGSIFAQLLARVNAHRAVNKGFVPREIFPFVLGMGGKDVCFEIVIKSPEGYLLKKRGTGEQGWQGEYQIIGTSFTTSISDAFGRLSREAFGDEPEYVFRPEKLEFVGVEIHEEKERGGINCFTLVWIFDISHAQAKSLVGDWKEFAQTDDEQIIGHHQNTLAWASIPEKIRPLIADLRN